MKDHRWLITTIVVGVVGLIIVFIYLTFFQRFGYTQHYSPINFEVELQKNHATWDGAHITHYKIVVDFAGYGSYEQMPWTLDVQNDQVASVINAQGKSVPVNDSVRGFMVTALFEDLENRYRLKAPSIQVSYNPNYGFPQDISVDPWNEPCCQEYDIKIRDFQVLP